MVLEELAAQQAVKYTQKYEAAARALKSLDEVTPWGAASPLQEQNTERVRQHWRASWRSVVDVIPTSESALREAAFREANGLVPCKTQDGAKAGKTGFRDAAIWMSAVEYARTNPDETVHFVSSNTKDFGDGQSPYQTPMDADVARLKNFVHLTSLDGVVERFTTSVTADEKNVSEILKSQLSCWAVADAARRASVPLPFSATIWTGTLGAPTAPARLISWMSDLQVQPGSIGEIDAYRIGEHEWCTATVRWLLAGIGLTEAGTHLVSAGCGWESRVLINVSSGTSDPRLTVLRSTEPTRLTDGEVDAIALSPLPPQVVSKYPDEPLPEAADRVMGETWAQNAGVRLSVGTTRFCNTCNTHNPRTASMCYMCHHPFLAPESILIE
ncbi:hypothetical protein GCM10010449_74970 [Streptomyces rectiviolaceus]|uniref:DUF4935 domain-containing protein n=2 Tax=Streptomyces rectiviolaceus TaxID=332591 RepID=A0ABP6NDG4_9ACTN